MRIEKQEPKTEVVNHVIEQVFGVEVETPTGSKWVSYAETSAVGEVTSVTLDTREAKMREYVNLDKVKKVAEFAQGHVVIKTKVNIRTVTTERYI